MSDVNHYSPHYDHDEERVTMGLDDNGSWVHRSAHEIRVRRLEEANVKLVGALDMIRETLNGGNVEDLLLTINRALEAAKT